MSHSFEPEVLLLNAEDDRDPAAGQVRLADKPLRMVVGVTSAQTCLVLAGRLRALREAGFDVTLVSAPGILLDACAETEGVSAIAVTMRREIAPFDDLLSLLRLIRLLLRLRPLITDFSTPKAGLLGNLAAWLLHVPHRVYTLRGLKLQGARGWKQEILLSVERLTARCAHVVLCNSESLQAEAIRLRIAPAHKLRLLGDGSSNGVDTERFKPGTSGVREELGIGAGELVIGFVGRLTRDKGVPELLRAFEAMLRKHPHAWLLLVGWFDAAEDALSQRWRRMIETHPRIRCTDYVADVAEYYRAMDLMVLPTHREGFPNAVLEASACGLPVVTTESTGARDAVLPEVTGLLVPAKNEIALAEAISTLLADGGLRRRMGEAGRRWVMERYSRERVLGLAVEFYKKLGTRE